MSRGISDNLDFLAARLHGRHSRMAEGARLEALCRLRMLPQFASAVLSGAECESAATFQQRLARELGREVAGIAAQLSSAGARLARWLAVRFQVENLKVLVRGLVTGRRRDAFEPYLLPLPREHALDAASMAAAGSVEEVVRLLPAGAMRKRLGEAIERHGKEGRSFHFEAALDCGYFEELLSAAEALGGEDRELVSPMVSQEIDTWHLMLVARGKFGHRLESGALLPMHVAGTGISRERFSAMLADPDLRTAAGRALGRAIDALPSPIEEGREASHAVDPADLEVLAWARFQRLAKHAFRRSHMGLAAVVAFVALRRVEVANLITISEGIRGQLPEEQVRARLIPRRSLEVAHV